MSKPLQWIIGLGVVVVVAAVVVSTLWPLFAGEAAWTGTGMMGPGQMMGGWGLPFFGLGMMLWPLLIVGLFVLGTVWLLGNLKPPVAPPALPASTALACTHCGNPIQPGWKACPSCGEKV